MDLPKADETTLESALAELAREGGPVPVVRGGETVAMLVAPEELERIEDALDAAIIRAARLEDRDEPRISLDELAARHGIDLQG